MAEIWTNYVDALDEHPIATKALTAALLSVLGDLAAQAIEFHTRPKQTEGRVWIRKDFRWDWKRAVRMSLYALLFAAPITHVWYLLLDIIYGTSASFLNSIVKMLTDQLIAAPVITYLFFAILGLLEGKGWMEVRRDVRREYWRTLKMNWKIWPAFLLFNFLFVPPALRVLFVNALGLVWGTYLSLIQNQHSRQDSGIELEAEKEKGKGNEGEEGWTAIGLR